MKNILKNKSLNNSLFDQALVSGSNFVSTLIIARLLGIYDFGVFASLWLVLLFINSIHASTIILPMMTIVSKHKNIKKYFSGLMVNQLLFLFFSFLVSVSVSFYYLDFFTNLDDILYISLLFGLVVIAYHAQDFYRRYFFVIKDFLSVLIIDISSYLLRIVILIYLLFSDSNLSINNIFVIIILTFVLGIVIAILRSDISIGYGSFESIFREHLRLSKWLLPSGLMQWTSINLFLVLSSMILGPVVVGAIKIGQNLVMAFNIILQGLENFIPTDGSKIYHTEGLMALQLYLKKVLIIGLFVAVMFGIFVSCYSSELIHFLYGDIYLPYSSVVLWYAVILCLMYTMIIMRVYIRIIEMTKIWFKAYFYTSIFSLVIAYPLIYFYKLHGVMFGILIAHILLLTITYILLKREEGVI